MANLSGANLCLKNRVDTVIKFIKDGINFKYNKNGNIKNVIIANTEENIKTAESIKNHKTGKSYFFYDICGNKYNLSDFEKTSDFGSNKEYSTLNAEGKFLADAGERATLLYLTKEFNSPLDSCESLFINNPLTFYTWMPTFIETKRVLNEIVDDLNSYNMIHAGSINDFTNQISKFCSSISININTWNPADIWLIKSTIHENIISEINDLNLQKTLEKDIKIKIINNFIYDQFKEKNIFPVSLKKINPKLGARVDYNNKPGEINLKKIIIGDMRFTNCDLTLDSMEIGIFKIPNLENDKIITFQNKGYPVNSLTTQVEITNDGSDSGGRLGKVPSSIINEIFNNYKMTKLDPRKTLINLDVSFSKEIFKWYSSAIVNAERVSKTFKNADELHTHLLNYYNTDQLSLKILGHKIQGLQMQYLLSNRNKAELTDIISKMVNGAMKINPNSGFFIKIY